MKARRRANVVWLAAVLAAGCATGYALVAPGPATVGDLQVNVEHAWNRAPSGDTPGARRDAAVWTRDGLLLDRIMIIPAVPDGEALFRDREGRAALPRYTAGMLPNELEALLRSSLTKLFGEGASSVVTSKLRPHRFGSDPGILLDFAVALSEGPDYKGLAGAFIADSKLYVLLYAAATPYYFDRLLPEAETLIRSARRPLPEQASQ